MSKKIREIEKGLLKKGFVKDDNDHTWFRLKVDGKITKIRTKTSHGSKNKDYGDTLLLMIRRQLHLETKAQLLRLIDCVLEYRDYILYLRTKEVNF